MSIKIVKEDIAEEFDRMHDRKSGFLITVNTNRSVSLDSVMRYEFEDRIEKFCEIIHKFVKTRKGYATDDNREFRYVYGIELGGNRKRLHGHIRVIITHRSNVYFYAPAIKHYFERSMNLPGIYVNLRYFQAESGSAYSNSNKNKMLKYITKDMN